MRKPKAPKTYEEAVQQLEDTLGRISDPDTPLEESLELYAWAAQLVQLCSSKLQTASLQIEEIDKKLRAAQTDGEEE